MKPTLKPGVSDSHVFDVTDAQTVPNLPIGEILGWEHAQVGNEPPRKMAEAILEPKEGHDGTFHVRLSWGDAIALPPTTDGGAVERGYVSVSYLSRLAADGRTDLGGAEAGLSSLLAR